MNVYNLDCQNHAQKLVYLILYLLCPTITALGDVYTYNFECKIRVTSGVASDSKRWQQYACKRAL